jgi:hypothetical protein
MMEGSDASLLAERVILIYAEVKHRHRRVSSFESSPKKRTTKRCELYHGPKREDASQQLSLNETTPPAAEQGDRAACTTEQCMRRVCSCLPSTGYPS